MTPGRNAFTLVELLAVVAVLGLLAAAMATRYGDRGEAKLRLAESRVQSVDRLARRLAEQRGAPVRMRIDLTEGLLSIEGEALGENKQGPASLIPRGVSLTQGHTSTESRDRGEIVVDYRSDGSSGSFALRLGSDRGSASWVLAAGGSGQVSVASAYNPSQPKGANHAAHRRDRDVEDLFRALQKKRFDAD